jgi:omega-hydroxy-beta-dihydromenaquinone-9 sulfotransferase
MYFDFDYWWRVVRHVWSLPGYSNKPRMLFKLLVLVPLTSLTHAIFFLLDYVFFPSLWTQKVERPVFVVGHARSGTTLMHRLLSADGDKFSYFLYWETFFPSLLQKKLVRAVGWIDQRLGSPIKRRLEAWDDKTFGPTRNIHNMSLWNAEEDMFAMAGAFVTQQWSLEVPMMDVIDIFHVDDMPHKASRWLHHYRELVKRQTLLYGGDKIHLAKNPVQSGWVDAIIREFPDARIVVMMRDPSQCLPSLLKLMEVTWSGKGWTAEDYDKSLGIMTTICFDHFRYPRAALARNPQTPQSVVDYRDLTSAPRETVTEVYRALGMEMTEEFDEWLLAQAEREKKHQASFEYSLGDYELPAERLETELAVFYEEYKWPRQSSGKS